MMDLFFTQDLGQDQLQKLTAGDAEVSQRTQREPEPL
jgi:hypothetical protein